MNYPKHKVWGVRGPRRIRGRVSCTKSFIKAHLTQGVGLLEKRMGKKLSIL